jgi:YcxB-like protein
MLTLQYSLTKEDYTNYYLHALWNTPAKKAVRRTYLIRQLIINVSIVAIFLYLKIFSFFDHTYLFIFFAFMVLSLGYNIFNQKSNLQKQAKKFADNDENASIFLLTTHLFSATGIQIKDEVSNTTLHWKAIVKKEENDAYYFLYTNSVQALIIPKNVFKTIEEVQQFEQLLNVHISFNAEVGHLIS